jgi:replicative DNA helicase
MAKESTTKAKTQTSIKIENKAGAKIPPSSIEAEQGLLSSILIDKEVSHDVFGQIEPSEFYSETHRILFEYMQELYRANMPIDFITMSDKVLKKDEANETGGIAYLTELTNFVPSAANYKSYLKLIKRDAMLRSLISAGQNIVNFGFENDDDIAALQAAEKEVFDLSKTRDKSTLTVISDNLTEVIERLQQAQNDPDSMKGLNTGFKELDFVTNGLQRGDLILLAARPSVGKTSLAMNIVTNAAIDFKAKVAVFSLEMPKQQIILRQLASLAPASMKSAQQGKLTAKEWDGMFAARKKLESAKIFIDDSSLNTPIEILSKCRRLKREHGLDLIMIDYLQLMSGGGKKTNNRQEEISEISRSLKIMARELDVPVIVLSQLSRAIEARKDHKPMLSDLRESGAIEQDADMVCFIHKPDKYADMDVAEEDKDHAYLIIAKHRNGETREDGIKLKWIGETTSYVDPDVTFTPSGNKQTLSHNVPSDDDAPPY